MRFPAGGRHRAADAVLASFLALLLASGSARGDLTTHRFPRLIDLSRLSIAGTQAELGGDPATLFAFVRDRIRTAAYQGVLRGPQGTLLSLEGNSADKAFLLRELLRSAGHECRFAEGTLDDAEVDELRRAVMQPMPARVTADAPEDAAGAALAQDLVDDARFQFGAILGALDAAGRELPPASAAASLAKDLRDHFWLQCQDAGNWVDLDPSFSQATLGRAFARVDRTMDSLPEALFHRVAVAVVVELKAPDAPAYEQSVLGFESTAAALTARTLHLTHQRDDWTAPTTLAGYHADLGGLLNALGSSASDEKVKPVLVHDAGFVVGDSFALGGEAEPSGGLGGLGGLADAIEPPAIAVAEWVDVTFTAPDGGRERVRVPLFDRIGYVARASGAVGEPEPLIGAELRQRHWSLSFFTGGLRNPVALTGETAVVAETLASDEVGTLVEITSLLETLNTSIAAIAGRLADSLQIDGAAGAFSTLSPQLIVSQLSGSGPESVIAVNLAWSKTRADGDDARLPIGKAVLDALVERMVMDVLLGSRGEGWGLPRSGYSVPAVFEAAAAQGIAIGLLDAPPPGVDAEAAARIASALAAGNFLIAPVAAVQIDGGPRTGWWQIDATTGATVDTADNGLHSATFEYLFVEQPRSGSQSLYWVYRWGQNTPIMVDVPMRAFAHLLSRGIIVGL